MHDCIRGVHGWTDKEDAEKCCNGWRREFDIPAGAITIPENPRRIWVRCEPHTEASDGKVTWCSRCGTRMVPCDA